jgi:RND superfamily putative drug exporter
MAVRKGSHRNVAEAVGGWSASHRWAAIVGWLAFVSIAFIVGSVVGQRQLTDVQMGNGEFKLATSVYDSAFPFHSGEQVLVQGRGSIRRSGSGIG